MSNTEEINSLSLQTILWLHSNKTALKQKHRLVEYRIQK
jgi:hypothetical protein